MGPGSLGLLERLPAQPDPSLPPLLLVHGATFGGAMFDLPRDGYSMMSALSGQGRCVYAVDIRGYGSSSGGLPMELPPQSSPPFARADSAVEDIGIAADFILRNCHAGQLDVAGFSWGSVTAARYASEHAEKIACLLLYAPLYSARNEAWLSRIADRKFPTALSGSPGAYRRISLSSLMERWQLEAAAEKSIEPDEKIAGMIFETLLAFDASGASEQPSTFRVPNGALADLVEIFNEYPMFKPKALTMRTLLVRGSGDVTSTDGDARNLLALIGSSDKDYVVISPGSHFLCFEQNRSKLYDVMNGFFARA